MHGQAALIRFSSLSAPTKIEELTARSDEKTQRSPAGDRTQGLAKFVGAEREENLIRNDPDKSEFTIEALNRFNSHFSSISTCAILTSRS